MPMPVVPSPTTPSTHPAEPWRFYPLNPNGQTAINFVDVAEETARPVIGPPLHKDIRHDERSTVVIVGGGYTGLSAALRLAEDPSLRIILLDAGRIGNGPSGKSAGHVGGLQATDDEVLKHCGTELGIQLLQAADRGPVLVRNMVKRYDIPCDMRDGYVTIHRDGTQTVEEGHGSFGINPYPFVLGLARAAKKVGVEIYENTQVTNIHNGVTGVLVSTRHGKSIAADYAIAAGGHRMAETIPELEHLREKTCEVRVTTLITSPIPHAVLERLMPFAEGNRYPFANTEMDVSYGSIDREGRIVFGAHATAWKNPDEDKIRSSLLKMFPTLMDDCKHVTGSYPSIRPFVQDEKLSFTADGLPLVGRTGMAGRIFYVGALGGGGIGAGVMLGEAAAKKIESLLNNDPSYGRTFDQFASVHHSRLPKNDPWRTVATEVGLRYKRMRRDGGIFATLRRRLGGPGF